MEVEESILNLIIFISLELNRKPIGLRLITKTNVRSRLPFILCPVVSESE